MNSDPKRAARPDRFRGTGMFGYSPGASGGGQIPLAFLIQETGGFFFTLENGTGSIQLETT